MCSIQTSSTVYQFAIHPMSSSTTTLVSSVVRLVGQRRVVLASQSPRRIELLQEVGLRFEVIPSTFEENLPKSQFPSPEAYVIENAKQKAQEVWNRVLQSKAANANGLLVIGCDTVVVHDGLILEKPTDKAHAFETLERLSDATHHVYSGVAVLSGANLAPHLFFEKTAVTFGKLHPEDIHAYIQTGEPMDKAGAYGIQGRARCFVKELHGCYNNVIGFPIQRFVDELTQLLASKQ